MPARYHPPCVRGLGTSVVGPSHGRSIVRWSAARSQIACERVPREAAEREPGPSYRRGGPRVDVPCCVLNVVQRHAGVEARRGPSRSCSCSAVWARPVKAALSAFGALWRSVAQLPRARRPGRGPSRGCPPHGCSWCWARLSRRRCSCSARPGLSRRPGSARPPRSRSAATMVSGFMTLSSSSGLPASWPEARATRVRRPVRPDIAPRKVPFRGGPPRSSRGAERRGEVQTKYRHNCPQDARVRSVLPHPRLGNLAPCADLGSSGECQRAGGDSWRPPGGKRGRLPERGYLRAGRGGCRQGRHRRGLASCMAGAPEGPGHSAASSA